MSLRGLAKSDRRVCVHAYSHTHTHTHLEVSEGVSKERHTPQFGTEVDVGHDPADEVVVQEQLF